RMALHAPSARHLATHKTSSGITLAKGAIPPCSAAASVLRDARDTPAPKPACETPRTSIRPTPGAAMPKTRPMPQPLRAAPTGAMPAMRRYEVSALGKDGDIVESRHVAPATPLFESAFSAFARGTLLTTTDGLCAIEDLVPGMKVETVEFGARPVLWIGSMTILPEAATDDPDQARMTRIMADTFGMGRPMADVMAGPGARMLHRPAALRELQGKGARSGQVFTPVADFEDGTSAIRITPPRPVTVYHLCLDRHASIKVSGLDMESFHPGLGLEQRIGPNALSVFLSLFPHIRSLDDFGPLAYPRASLATLDSLTAA
ncbi:MAG: Hint domain-containing protein, partial [Paracoccaceae bacterium]|nr:Hint domain-containing protein [Paracoccaceae bacterium]